MEFERDERHVTFFSENKCKRKIKIRLGAYNS